jgi:hypothetical protein
VKDAATKLTQGYTVPTAYDGVVPGGDNFGRFHITCDSTGKFTGVYVNQDGATDNYLVAPVGNYPLNR